MKTYTLQGVESLEGAIAALRKELPGQESPWILAVDDDVIAYFDVASGKCGISDPAVIADISGRHFEKDACIIKVLQTLQKRLGGTIHNDDDLLLAN